MIVEPMAKITLNNGATIRSEYIKRGLFSEKGANAGIKRVGGPHEKIKDDELLVELNDPDSKAVTITGKDAREDAEKLDAADIPVFRNLKKRRAIRLTGRCFK
jgi:hypothetical protein